VCKSQIRGDKRGTRCLKGGGSKVGAVGIWLENARGIERRGEGNLPILFLEGGGGGNQVRGGKQAEGPRRRRRRAGMRQAQSAMGNSRREVEGILYFKLLTTEKDVL